MSETLNSKELLILRAVTEVHINTAKKFKVKVLESDKLKAEAFKKKMIEIDNVIIPLLAKLNHMYIEQLMFEMEGKNLMD